MSQIFGRNHSELWQGQKIKQMLVFEAVGVCNRFQLQNPGLIKMRGNGKAIDSVLLGNKAAFEKQGQLCGV
ncbi:hypothetical protein [Parasediminibacterium sp. JCM 36343]|uniref:hypothetical protein n=1 Tax=Parasediminibacterium sp. JCM 36343 TaxID=3374279 RepID=UPI00397D5A3B